MSQTPDHVIVFDTTLRDGEQAPGFSMDVPSKLSLARALDALGVDIIEAGFPIASPADSEATRQIAREVRRPVIAALARCRQLDIEEAGRALEPAERKRIHTFLATSDLHIERKLRITRESCLEAIIDGVRRARQYTDDVEFSAEDATRTDRDFLCRVVEAAIAQGATTINLPDTVGYGIPHEAGIHQDGMLKDARTYEIMRPQDVGQTAEQLVLGRHSGRHAVQRRCEQLGMVLTADELAGVYHGVITMGEHRKAIGDNDLRR